MSALAAGPPNGRVELPPRPEPRREVARSLASVRRTIDGYYSAKISKYGATPLGVDWTCVATQELRFVQLLRLCDFSAPFSLNDLGCGYGALLAYLAKRHARTKIDYLGIDVSAAMIAEAKTLYGRRPATRFHRGHSCPRIADYSIASGIFNVKLEQKKDAWEFFVARTLRDLRAKSRRGFAVNFIQLAAGRPSQMLYRAKPDRWAKFCEDELNCRATTLADYGLREFTLLVRSRSAASPAETA